MPQPPTPPEPPQPQQPLQSSPQPQPRPQSQSPQPPEGSASERVGDSVKAEVNALAQAVDAATLVDASAGTPPFSADRVQAAVEHALEVS